MNQQPSSASHMPQRQDVAHTRQALQRGHTTALAQMALSLEIAQSEACKHAFLQLDAPAALQAASQANPSSPLAGLAVSVKDLFDVAGQVSTAGSRVLIGAQAATQDCPAVARLKAAGATVIGRTNMVEFAFSGVGINPHYGTPANPCDTALARIPGGSSSGAAVSVASGAAFIGLGSDTGGSIRIPAALCGIVGFKPTARLVPTQGCVPLSHTLDTVCALTRSVADALLAHEILSSSKLPAGAKPLSAYRLAVVTTQMLDALDDTVAHAFASSLARLRTSGAQIVEIALPEIAGLGSIQSRGGFSAPEALAWQRQRGLWPARQSEYDPRVAQRIALAEAMGAADYVDLHIARQAWIAQTSLALAGFDAVLSPTVPIVAPRTADVAPGNERDGEFFRVNALLLRNTSVVNMLDGCALSLPCHSASELPVGLMVWHAALHDADVLYIAQCIEAILAG